MSLAGLALELGFEAVALEYDDFNNASRWDDFVRVMWQAGVKPGAWFTTPSNLSVSPPGASFLIAEIEGTDDFNGAVSWIPKVTLPKAIVTTFDGLIVKDPSGATDKAATKAHCKPLVDAGFFCQYEAYFMAQPDNTEAAYCGFAPEKTAPVLGVKFNGKTLDQQTALQVPGYGIYLAEYLR